MILLFVLHKRLQDYEKVLFSKNIPQTFGKISLRISCKQAQGYMDMQIKFKSKDHLFYEFY